jgi:hypothetical protein
MVWLLLTLTAVEAKEIRLPGVPVSVVLPEVDEETEEQPWGYTEGDATTEIKLAMKNDELFANVTFQNTDYQPSIKAVQDNALDELVTNDDTETEITPGELTLIEHPELGDLIEIPLQIHDGFMDQDFWGRVMLFSVEGAAVVVNIVTSKEEPEHLDAVVEEVLGMVKVKKEPLADKDLPFGDFTAEAGYTLSLPGGWRALTEDEARSRSTARIAGSNHYSGKTADIFVIDSAHLNELVFNCSASADGTLEVLNPKRSPTAAANFRTFAEVSLKGGRFRFVDGTEERVIDVMTETPVQPSGEGELEFLDLGDRPAYLWTVEGTLYDDPVEAAVFYTAYDEVALTCYCVADEEDEGRIGSFTKVMRELTVVDGELHPMHFSLKAQYLAWWPWSHPALQLYWLPIPVFLLGSWLIFKD